ncbi:MAG: amidophosphoribosyltransferase [Planctomycetales bacterium]|nr:amidophosphoribosyltransferase [Planctomycetales bacterium]
MDELQHECGVAAVYHLNSGDLSPLIPKLRRKDKSFIDPATEDAQTVRNRASRLIPGMLLDMQNRGQLAAGLTSYNPARLQLLQTRKDVGGVAEVFRMNHEGPYKELMAEHAGQAAIGHVRYATCGKDDPSYAQPFERQHIARSKWFSFAFNGQLANYTELRQEILSTTDFHLTRETDTEVLHHLISHELSLNAHVTPVELLRTLSKRLDGSWNIVFLNARGQMFVSRDPLGMRPLCYAVEGSMFAAASESVALTHLGFSEDSVKNVPPGHVVVVDGQTVRVEKYAESPQKAHCFFEWIYFANAGSTFDDAGVYLSRKRLGEELARRETLTIDDDVIVVPVPDTAKAAADSMAFQLKVPSLEGLIRNRYIGRTFIEGNNRADKVRMKYTPLPEVMEGKRILLVDDSIVRATTLKELLALLKDRGRAKEIHVRIACPPIISPCFYGIDMSTVGELFAPAFMAGHVITPDEEQAMADAIGATSLRYLPVEALANCVGLPEHSLCQACVNTVYPTPAGERMYQLALTKSNEERIACQNGGSPDEASGNRQRIYV